MIIVLSAACLRGSEDQFIVKFRALEARRDKLIDVAKSMREWIDSIPLETALPIMPSFDRNWADSVISGNLVDQND